MTKTLIVDGQMWQTNAFFRGMGGYAFGLLRAAAAAQPELRLIIVLNQQMIHDDERIAGIKHWLPEAEIHILDLPHEPKPHAGEEERARNQLDQFIAGLGITPQEACYFIPALFMFQYCAVFPTGTRRVLLFHDLMPLIYREELGKYFPGHIYFPRFKTIFEADAVVTNSQTTANDLLAYLGVDAKRVVNIDGSLNEQLVHEDAAGGTTAGILAKLDVEGKPYVLMPTGGLENKNTIRATEAFRILCDTDDNIQLVATSFFDGQAKRELRLIAGECIIFTDNVAADELLQLYAHSTAVLMPSLYEGLGLPVLEGVAHGKPVACSDVPVFREFPHFEEALYAFDPFDVADIADALQRACAQADFEAKKRHYQAILEKYNWQRSARLFMETVSREELFTEARPAPAKKIAVLCPDPRRDAGVAVFAQRMYGYAQRAGFECIYFIDPAGGDEVGEMVLPDYIRHIALCYDINAVYTKLAEHGCSEVIRFVAADPQFTQLHRAALAIPGYAYISDTDYGPMIAALADKHMISAAQASAERTLIAAAQAHNAFDALSVIASSPGIIVESQHEGLIRRALAVAGLDIPVLTTPPHEMLHNGEDIDARQREAYERICAFIEENSEAS